MTHNARFLLTAAVITAVGPMGCTCQYPEITENDLAVVVEVVNDPTVPATDISSEASDTSIGVVNCPDSFVVTWRICPV